MAYENNGFGTYNDVEVPDSDIYENEVHVNDVYENANGTVNHQIPTTSVIVQPPKYEDVYKPPYVISTALHPTPPQYIQNFPPQQNLYPLPQPLQQFQPQFIGTELEGFRYKKLHLVHGVLTLVFGGIIMVLDPLLPAIFQYYYSIFPAGLFMVISGICSIHGSKKRNKCSLKAALTFNIFALMSLFAGYIMGLIAVSLPYLGSGLCINVNCMPSTDFYVAGVRGLAVFNTVFEISLFVLILWDSTLKCGTVCCNKNASLQTNNSQNP